MNRQILNPVVILILCILLILTGGCKKKKEGPNNIQKSDIWDIDKDGYPKFVKTNYIELDKIYRISKYRSSVGHDYSDAFEHCRSMKHYFEPKGDIDWSAVKIYSPVTGIITRMEDESMGKKIEIASDDYPAFRFIIFHVILSGMLQLNDTVTAGEEFGTHIGSVTTSDIAVMVNDPTRQGRLISYFEILTDSLFSEYVNRGVKDREEMIISKELRDSFPLTCNGETFVSPDTLENWVVLK